MTIRKHFPVSTSVMASVRPRVQGKFIFLGDEKLYVRGVTYGTFRPDEDGNEYDPKVVEQDFAQMAANGLNAVRTYTVPPRWLLDAAQRMASTSWLACLGNSTSPSSTTTNAPGR